MVAVVDGTLLGGLDVEVPPGFLFPLPSLVACIVDDEGFM